MNIPLSTS